MTSFTGFCQKTFMVGMLVLYLLSAGKGMGFTAALCCGWLASVMSCCIMLLLAFQVCYSTTVIFASQLG